MTSEDARPDGSGRRVTLAEVAERAGVSRSAASFALNGRLDQRLSAETMARVRRAADDLGYRANVTAKTLRTGRSGTVALVSDFVSSTSFANSMVRGALERLREAGLLLFTVDTQGDAEVEQRFLDDLIARDIDGILYASMFTRRVEVPASARRVPLVLMNCEATEGPAVSSVIPDEEQAGAAAAQLLLQAGHDRGIWFVGTFPPGRTGGDAWHAWGPMALPLRLRGLRDALQDAGTDLAGEVAIDDDWDVRNGFAAAQRLLADGVVPRALVCINDAVAIGVGNALRRAGLHVPTDVSLVSFDGGLLAAASDPALVSLRLPQVEIGRRAAELLLEHGEARVERLRMPPTDGASIAPPRD
ncbi:LacI family DNA-binding transcriptional regulator [Microbacterium dextranolyticum]|uniref:Transcriptional regulator n=1 Tax=Microbacterium dextranolyticum TaxID=36806 RepID=A0A9W6HKJ0_9MICO|nr:LacI family DNA-binding transcriptional regulator [Microbacterium dextranolyticum]MBM7461863.1 LacI family transcriptional regulator [Microbacterium dextranolyticum]GLJ94104.1 transcriptional regulator [Microbacterium dextranolyticum]